MASALPWLLVGCGVCGVAFPDLPACREATSETVQTHSLQVCHPTHCLVLLKGVGLHESYKTPLLQGFTLQVSLLVADNALHCLACQATPGGISKLYGRKHQLGLPEECMLFI